MLRFLPLLIAAVLAAGPAAAADSLALFGSMESGTCRDTFTGEADTTQSVSLEYRRETANFSAIGYGRVAPSGGNCAESSFSFDAEIERRFEVGGDWYGLARLGAERTTTTGSYRHVDGSLVLFAAVADGSPAYTALAGGGRCFGPGCSDPDAGGAWRVEMGANLAPNDYVGSDAAQSVHFRASHVRALLGGELEAEFEAEAPWSDFGTMVTGQRIGWSRELSDHIDLTFGLRRKSGLGKYRSPFDPTIQLDGRPYALGTTDDTVTTFEVGVRAEL